MKCRYIKIPDIPPKLMYEIVKYNRYDIQVKKRPFDAIMITPNKNYCIECKINYDTFLPHQKIEQTRINKINPYSFFVIRKKYLTKKIIITIEYENEVVFKTNDLEKVIMWFKNKGEKNEKI